MIRLFLYCTLAPAEEAKDDGPPAEAKTEEEPEDIAPKKAKKAKAKTKQLIPSHYYGPPSAGWGGFHPGHTGGGWGAPYWYK